MNLFVCYQFILILFDFYYQILTRDSVSVAVDAVVYYRIFDPVVSVCNVQNVNASTKLLAQTTLRNILSTLTLAQLLTERESISGRMQV